MESSLITSVKASLLAVSCIMASFACTPSEPHISDSSGVAIVKLPPIATTAAFVDTTPVLDIADLVSTNSVIDARTLSDGGIVVKAAYQVHFLHADGTLRKSVGVKGSGPNEFEGLLTMCVTHGDTIVVYDGASSKTTVLDRDGNFVSTIPNTELVVRSGCFNDGTYLSSAASADKDGRQLQRLRRIRLNGDVVNELATVSNSNISITPTVLVSVYASDSTFIVADPERDEIRRFHRDGKLLNVFRFTDSRSRKVNPSQRPQVTLEIEGEGPAAPPRTGRWPIFDRALLDDSGSLWVETRLHGDTSFGIWTSYDWSGNALHTVAVPGIEMVLQGFPFRQPPSVFEVTKRGIFVSREDAEGVPHFVIYRRP